MRYSWHTVNTGIEKNLIFMLFFCSYHWSFCVPFYPVKSIVVNRDSENFPTLFLYLSLNPTLNLCSSNELPCTLQPIAGVRFCICNDIQCWCLVIIAGRILSLINLLLLWISSTGEVGVVSWRTRVYDVNLLFANRYLWQETWKHGNQRVLLF